jgi:hypothetical protein
MMKCGKPGCDATWDDLENPVFEVKAGFVEGTHREQTCKRQHLNQWHRQQTSVGFGPPIRCRQTCQHRKPDTYTPLDEDVAATVLDGA